MTPVYYLNPGGGPSSSSFPLVELEEDQQHLQLLLSPPSSSLTPAPDPRASLLLGDPEQHDQYPKARDHMYFMSSRGLRYYGNSSGDHHHHPRLSSSFKLMRKTTSSSRSSSTTTDDKPTKLTLKIQDQRYHVNEISTSSSSNHNSRSTTTPAIRVCSDCNTTTTPLWRSGPRGPKSLCNACGIRQRKARRAAAEAAAETGAVMAVEASSSSKANHQLLAHKDKKPRTGHNVGQAKKLCDKHLEKKLCLKKIAPSLSNNSAFQGVFSRDVEEAAILLMELSCGLVPS